MNKNLIYVLGDLDHIFAQDLMERALLHVRLTEGKDFTTKQAKKEASMTACVARVQEYCDDGEPNELLMEEETIMLTVIRVANSWLIHCGIPHKKRSVLLHRLRLSAQETVDTYAERTRSERRAARPKAKSTPATPEQQP